MSNSLTGKIDCVADSKTWHLQFTINGLCALETELGAGEILDVQKLIGEKPSMTMLRTLFWASLQENHPGTTKEQAGTIMSAVGLVRATELVSTALVAALGMVHGGDGPLAIPATGPTTAPASVTSAQPLAATG